MKPQDGDHFAHPLDDLDVRADWDRVREQFGLGPYPDPSSPDPMERSDAYARRKLDHVSETALDPAFVPPPIAPGGTSSGWGTDPFHVMARVVNHFHRQAMRGRGKARYVAIHAERFQARQSARHTPIDPSRIDPFGIPSWLRDYTGIPTRTYRGEDRAQEARRGARAMRETGWLRMLSKPDDYTRMTAAVRAFVPLTPSGEEAKRFLNSLYGWRLQR